MKISESTKISQLIQENPETIEVIASINKHFRKLKNPVLRKVLASRVSIADAAIIGGVSISDFFKKLKTIGFELEENVNGLTNQEKMINENTMENIDQSKVTEMDVRPIIASGSDPFKDINETVKTMPGDGILLIINSFEPIPIINHLKNQGFESKTERPEDGVVHTYLWKTEKEIETLPEVENSEIGDFESAVAKFGKKVTTIDVRHLEMPEPMVLILQEIENLPESHALFVHHKRIPQFLLPELKKRDFSIFNHEIDENNMDLILFKSNS
jgi:uncharacterized protein (DUF2249 family)